MLDQFWQTLKDIPELQLFFLIIIFGLAVYAVLSITKTVLTSLRAKEEKTISPKELEEELDDIEEKEKMKKQGNKQSVDNVSNKQFISDDDKPMIVLKVDRVFIERAVYGIIIIILLAIIIKNMLS
jgi:hypothetical protein